MASSSDGVKRTLTLENLAFENEILKSLPVDESYSDTQREVKGACFALVNPTPVLKPELVAACTDALSLLDLDEKEVESEEFNLYMSGSKIIPGSKSAAHCYCGHQFGHFSGQLGDGATMFVGQVKNAAGQVWELQFKGAGKTPFSRTADGRKVLRSSIREFLCSEAMYKLGIPTTRAGSIVTSSTLVRRDMHYTGDVIEERATVITRIAQTFLRFGSFEISRGVDPVTHRAGPSNGNKDILKQLANYTIQQHFPQHSSKPGIDSYLGMYVDIVERTAKLVAQWQCVGFCHGVLNTDNMSIIGLTIDYGPFGFMDSHDPDFICNSSDNSGRYSYANQPKMCRWNLAVLGESLDPILPIERSKAVLEETFDAVYQAEYLHQMKKKLGLIMVDDPGDTELVEALMKTMQSSRADFTNTFRVLSSVRTSDMGAAAVDLVLGNCEKLDSIRKSLAPSISSDNMNRLLQIARFNPRMLLQYGVDSPILLRELEKQKRLNEFEHLTEESLLESNTASWKKWIAAYSERLMLEESASDDTNLEECIAARVALQNSVNPAFVLRNHIAQLAIDTAEKGDYREVNKILKLLQQPYTEHRRYVIPLIERVRARQR